jgi:biotin synthase
MNKFDYSLKDLENLYHLPLMQLVSKAHHIHTQFHDPAEIQVCNLISIKTGGCPEDCKYCAQSSRYQTSVSALPMMSFEEVMQLAKKAINRGATRVCLVAAWREVRDSKQFDEVLRMTKAITNLGAEVCCCLGMMKLEQAKRLKEAGTYAYSHNLDTSEKFYKTITTTRNYQDRLNTLDIIEEAGISVCCGGILGMGETIEDRLELILTLCTRNPHPDSVPLNRLSAIPGTPLEKQTKIAGWELLRAVAVTRIVMPKTMIRLSSGRIDMSYEEQALCFFAGANSIHIGEKLLTVPNTSIDKDEEMFQILGLKKRAAFAKESGFAGCQ